MSQGLRFCPGKYCGYALSANGSESPYDCTACPWGFRVPAAAPGSYSRLSGGATGLTSLDLCQQCTAPLNAYDWLYLGFMALAPLCLHWFFIEMYASGRSLSRSGHRRHRIPAASTATCCQLLLHLGCSLIECSLAAVASLLLYDPVGSLTLRACGVQELADWYTPLFNPMDSSSRSRGYQLSSRGSFHCTQEAVYPLYTIVMVYYALDLVAMLLLRPIMSSRHLMAAISGACCCCCSRRATNNSDGCAWCQTSGCDGQRSLVPGDRGAQWPSRTIYAALYFLPALVLLHAIFGGLLYYSYPFVTLVIFLVTLAVHLSSYDEQSILGLLKGSAESRRNLCVVAGHCLAFAFGIVSTCMQLSQEPSVTGLLLLLVPLPYAFYVLTHRFTSPEAVESVVPASQAVSGEQSS